MAGKDATATVDEQADARLALFGLEGYEDGPGAGADADGGGGAGADGDGGATGAGADGAGRGPRLFTGAPEPEALLEHLGFTEFRPGQREAVSATLEGRDSLIVMPTGGGKSLCYQLPGLAGSDLTIVVSPLIALMSDQVRRLQAGGHPALMLASGLSEEAGREALRQISGGEARIAYCSPERFGSTSFLNAVSQRRVDLMAIDEAHCLSEWGHDFRPDYLRLPKALERLGRPPVMAATATATKEVAAEIRGRLGMREPLIVRSGFDRPNLSFDTVCFEGKGSKARKLALLTHCLGRQEYRPAIVYCGTRRDTEEVAERLREAGISADGYHAGMAPDERASVQHRFMNDDLEVVTATNAFGMGIDKASVRSVWHWALPTSVEAYYQEAGRAGRDGAPARAVLLAMRSDLGRLIQFIRRREVDPDAVTAYIHALHARAAGSDGAGALVMDNPRDDAERVRLAVAERGGALSVEPAPGGRLEVRLGGQINPGELAAACRMARDRGWRAYRAIEAYAFSSGCRRRALLDHFGDDTPVAPEDRCCDICNPKGGLPDVST
ncbi:MAG TPA: ATP-dependent DNA helicase RecQ, partial [Solirubrobacterales bacterium]|nr:ATP-dependent DNA helicase RecQ [Solirubrobacterales bacterium]